MAGGVHGRGHTWWGEHAWQGGMCGREACMAGGMHGRGCAWQQGMHVRGMHGRGVCMVGGMQRRGMHGRGHAWWGVWQGGVHATHAPPNTTRYGWSMRGWYASYWNAFLFLKYILTSNKFIKSNRCLQEET